MDALTRAMRQQRQLWICGAARPERISLGKGWQVRLKLRAWRSKIPVPWSAPVAGRRPALPHEVLAARLCTPGWPDEGRPGFDEAFVLEFADGTTWTAPQGERLVMQRLRTPQRNREGKEWRFT